MSYKVLIVDDSKLARMSVAKLLNALQSDWTRFEATNADEALAVVKQSAIDVVLLDYNMPGRDGLQLAADLHALNPNMPVAVVSANHQTEIVTGAKEAGATFLAKPLSEQALREFLNGAVARLKTTAP
jgi:CheY-like chemotaxis protein